MKCYAVQLREGSCSYILRILKNCILYPPTLPPHPHSFPHLFLLSATGLDIIFLLITFLASLHKYTGHWPECFAP